MEQKKIENAVLIHKSRDASNDIYKLSFQTKEGIMTLYVDQDQYVHPTVGDCGPLEMIGDTLISFGKWILEKTVWL